MAEAKTENRFVSKLNTGFPDYLDWEKLRAEGLDYLGKLSGKIWTDHNVHDPGITILEILCYALMDLGYRTNLPVEDIFARNPDDKTKENNFFTASEILTCNPLTITDFRKLLIDIDGIKNAWLEDSFDTCSKRTLESRETVCSDCYNGLYKVYIEFEKEFDLNKPEDKEEHDELIKKIWDVLMAHRNLCEDFMSLYILCRQPIGLCVDVELEVNADAEEVYRNIVEALRNFFSPSPQFYTLRQLLEDKKKNIEEIFAGRPYNISESHGFVDTDELEQINLKKEIHLSDVYSVILGVKGVRNVSNLAWRENCTSTPIVNRHWIWSVPENHVPDFSPTCSVFKFVRNGLPVSVDSKKFNELFEIDFRHNGKVAYKMPSPYLDVEMPKGSFRADLGDYQSIQNEFPRVYGINKGGLPSNVPDKRKAQAYQLKGYLLFFDQLLANYLAQLKNLRNLFVFSSPANKNERHTYFLNQLTDVPELDKLLRFNGDSDDKTVLGIKGSTLATAVKRKPLEDAIRDGTIKKKKLEDLLIPLTYPQQHSCQLAISNMLQDMMYNNFIPQASSTSENCWFFYFFTSAPEIAIVSRNFYATEKKAIEAGNSVKFAGTYRDNYHFTIDKNGEYSFSLELTISSYSEYLQQIVEDDNLYNQRRQDFLNHLLSRFAEKFTDFALLSFGFLEEKKLIEKDIQQKERFLSQYGSLSSNRGKSYDYWLDGWNNDNLSGFEQRTLALAGINDIKRHHLCHFTVEEFEEYYVINILDADQKTLFSSPDKYYSKEAAQQAAKEMILALGKEENYKTFEDQNTISTRLRVNCGAEKQLVYEEGIKNEADIIPERNVLYKLFSFKPDDKDIHVSKTVHRIILEDSEKREIARSKKHFDDEELALEYLPEVGELITDASKWDDKIEPPLHFQEIEFQQEVGGVAAFVDLNPFKIHSSDDVEGKKNKWEYALLDTENSFKLKSLNVYETKSDAETACKKLLVFLATAPGLIGEAQENGKKFELLIKQQEELITNTNPVYDSKNAAEDAWKKIKELLRLHLYSVSVKEFDYRWTFSFLLGYNKDEKFLFNCTEAFGSYENALKKANEFYQFIEKISLGSHQKELALNAKLKGENLVCIYTEKTGSASDKKLKEKITKLFKYKQEIHAALQSNSPTAFDRFITNDVADTSLKYVYRLTDKDNYHAEFKGGFDRTSMAAAMQNRKNLFQQQLPYQYTEIILGNILHERKDETRNIKWYHYQVKSRGRGVNNSETILFESVKGYRSKEDAQKAFDDNYLLILQKAMDKKNYGKDRFISLEELIQHSSDECEKVKTVVFVPEETKKHFNWYPGIIISSIRRIAKQYPVRQVTKEENAFYKLFDCETDNRTRDEKDNCNKKTDGTKFYYFVLLSADGRELWQSLAYFTSHDEALQRFHFFRILLQYPGNYHVQEDFCYCQKNSDDKLECCRWQILIREVLAESKRRFARKPQAWQAIEEFICISQSKGSFQTYLNDENCSYTFQVSCNQAGLIHTCKYDTEQERDEVRKKLIAAAVFPVTKYPELKHLKDNEWRFIDGEGLALATIIDRPDDLKNAKGLEYDCIADLFLEIFKNMPLYQPTIGIPIYGNNEAGQKVVVRIIKPSDQKTTISEWKQMLCEASCSYPVIKNEKNKYEVVIRYKGVSCNEKLLPVKFCDPVKDIVIPEDSCAVSWKSECCFDTCNEAWEFYEEVKKCLAKADHYLPVFDCECGPFGIKLNCNCSEKRTIGDNPQEESFYPDDANKPLIIREQKPRHNCCSEIVAYNPQRYSTPKMDCDAVERAKKLINCEGLYAVEHILLRPRCEEDCNCKIPVCDNKVINCTDWKWIESGDKDYCDPKKDEINFVPGADPYSFIATIMLPAWPERFRKQENQLLLENLLYREAPAHVLIRILWLTPSDFCQFESVYKQWSRWGIRKLKGCSDFSLCDFRDFLFSRSFECLSTCDECQPCAEKESFPDPCKQENSKDPCASKLLIQNNINELFCWQELICDEQFQGPLVTDIAATAHFMIEKPDEVKARVGKKKKAEPVKLTPDEPPPQLEIVTMPETKAKTAKSAGQIANKRRKRYLTVADEIVLHSAQNHVALKVQAFLQGTPTPETTSSLLNEIVQNKIGSKKGKALKIEQIEHLVRITICYFLDKMSFRKDGEETNAKERTATLEKIFAINEILKKVRRTVKKMVSIFDYWESHEVKESEPDVPIQRIESLLTGKDN